MVEVCINIITAINTTCARMVGREALVLYAIENAPKAASPANTTYRIKLDLSMARLTSLKGG